MVSRTATRLGLSTAIVAAGATLGGLGAVPATAAPMPAPSTHPCTVWTESPNDTEINTDGEVLGHPFSLPQPPGDLPPSLDLTAGTMAVSGSTLVVRISVVDLEAQVPAGFGGISWRMDWSFAGTGYAAWATYTSSGATLFSVAKATTPVTTLPGTGHLVTGPGGYAEVDVPLAEVGSSAPGAVLVNPAGTSFRDLGDLSAVPGQGTLVEVGADTAGPQKNYIVGTGCG